MMGNIQVSVPLPKNGKTTGQNEVITPETVSERELLEMFRQKMQQSNLRLTAPIVAQPQKLALPNTALPMPMSRRPEPGDGSQKTGLWYNATSYAARNPLPAAACLVGIAACLKYLFTSQHNGQKQS